MVYKSKIVKLVSRHLNDGNELKGTLKEAGPEKILLETSSRGKSGGT